MFNEVRNDIGDDESQAKLLLQYAQLLYKDELAAEAGAGASDDEGDGEINIEAEIQQELADIRKPQSKPLFWSIRLDVQCGKRLCQFPGGCLAEFQQVLFFKTRAPVEPVSFVHRICEDAAKNPQLKRTRFCKRLSPMTLMGKANEDGLEKVAKEVLAPHFHQEPRVPRKVSLSPAPVQRQQTHRTSSSLSDLPFAITTF